MLILGIDTATEQISVALGGHEGVIARFEVARGRRHAEILTPAIEFVCTQADIGLEEVGLVAVDLGPGLFTGMRVGLSAAKALAFGLRVPMIGISSLDLLARNQDVLCVGDGAHRYRDQILDGFHCEFADDRYPSAAPLVQLAHAQALREEWVSPSKIAPIYLRAPDAQINWSTRASAPEGRR